MKNNKGEVNNRNEPPKSVIKGYGFETCNNYDCKTRISPTIIVYLAFVPLSRHFR